MLAKSNNFFKEVKTPNKQDEFTLNAYNVLFEDLGLSSISGINQKYLSWFDYCKSHRFISKLGGPVPDMIVPKNFQSIEYVADPFFKTRKGA